MLDLHLSLPYFKVVTGSLSSSQAEQYKYISQDALVPSNEAGLFQGPNLYVGSVYCYLASLCF
jgi:hypothetical protein